MARHLPDERRIVVSARMDPKLVEQVRAVAGISFSQIVEEGVRLWLAQQPKPKRQARRKTTA
jgi:hypothetical protein